MALTWREYVVIGITLVGAWLRFHGLGDRPLWVDESVFAFLVRDGGERQEWLSIWFARAIGAESEFGLRFLSALAGTLTIPAVYLVSRNLYATGFVAVFPLFVFWGTLARPYAVAGLFIALGWRWWPFYLLALVSTPVALVGVKLTRSRLKLVGILVVVALGIFLLRPDVGRGWHLGMLLTNSRFWYVPALAFVLYCADYMERQGKRVP